MTRVSPVALGLTFLWLVDGPPPPSVEWLERGLRRRKLVCPPRLQIEPSEEDLTWLIFGVFV